MWRRVPLTLVVGLFIFCVVGCAAVQHGISAYEACLNDSDCKAQMAANAASASNIANITLPKVCLPSGDVPVNGLALLVSGVASVVTGIYLGWKKCKGGK